jgi:arylsulfatase A-like enzyme
MGDKARLRKSITATAIMVALAGGGLLAPRGVTGEAAAAPGIERRDPPPDTRPDLVIIMSDDQRADTLWAMPTLQAELVAKGTTFTNAMVPNPLCCPSRASFLTGQYSHNNGVWTNTKPFGGAAAFQKGQKNSLATWLDEAGYATILSGKYLNGYGAYKHQVPPGWDDWFAFAGPTDQFYFGTRYSDNGTIVTYPQEAYSTLTVGERVASFIRQTPQDTPLFAYLAPHAAHGPYQPDLHYENEFSDLESYRPPNYNERQMKLHHKPSWLRKMPSLTPEDDAWIDERARDQLRMLLSLDDSIAEVLTALEDTGRLENTMIVYASDNGFFWGEHRLDNKSAPYEAALRIPLVIRYDPLTQGAQGENDSIVLNLDIAPTFAALGQATPGRLVDGRNLLPLLRGTTDSLRSRFTVESMAYDRMPAYCGTRTERHLYVR